MLGDDRFPGGAAAWFSSLVFHIGAWRLLEDKKNQAKVSEVAEECREAELLDY